MRRADRSAQAHRRPVRPAAFENNEQTATADPVLQ
jgi:hypothetical protein